jgi:hypothetical protein
MADADNKNFGSHDLILRFENECDPFKYQVDDVCIWAFFRFWVWEHIKIGMEGLSERQTSRSLASPLHRVRAVFAMAKELAGLRALKSGGQTYDIVALTTTDRLRDRAERGFKNVYLDYFDPPLQNMLTIFVDPLADRAPVAAPVLFASSRTVWPRVTLVENRRVARLKELASLYSDLTNFLTECDWDQHMTLPPAAWRKRLAYALARVDSFAGIFETVKPKVVLSDCYYNKEWAVAAANRAGIPVMEFQHGIVHDGHMAYLFDPDSAARHRDLIPLPDKLLTFGRYFSEIFLRRGFWAPSDVEEVGFPRMEHEQSKFRYHQAEHGEKLQVLVSSQWILADRLAAFLDETLRNLRTDDVVVNVKPHPHEPDTNAYRRIDGLNVLEGERDFYELLGEHHIHCSVYSTTLLPA